MLDQLFISRVRVAIISLFLKKPDEAFHVREIARQVGTETNAVRRELRRLQKIGLLANEPRGNRVYYRVKTDFPFFSELQTMVFKDGGFGQKLRGSLSDLGKVKYVSISRAFVKNRTGRPERVDFIFIGQINLSFLQKIMVEEEKNLNREINYTVFSEDEFEFRRKQKDRFLEQTLAQPHLVIFGDEIKFDRL